MNPQTLKYPDGFEGYYCCRAEKRRIHYLQDCFQNSLRNKEYLAMHKLLKWKYLNIDSKPLFVFINANFNMKRHQSAFKLMEAICF